ncbi:YT521-B-like domain-containing protein [Podospora appendiculata]|uniref:YT521-B-like domain-containing protein n=1 Tax=Podospora appendiculata TaxID=314037 RepID=A0AAE1CFH3_9PEZI|nr:YT521-B-like domain-containing protein [Podospora appendiculata]
MPSPPQSVKLDLDARAAVLKEKLLKSRSQSQAARLNSNSPANEPEPKAKAAPNASRLGGLDPGPLPLERGKPPPSQFVPHQMPRPPPQTSVPADANDIAALITSISSTTRDNETSSSSNSSMIKQQAKAADKQTNVPQYANPQTAASSPLVSAPAQPQLYNEIQPTTPQGRPGGNPPVGSSKLRTPSHHQPASPSSGEEGEITSEGDGSGSKRDSSSTDKHETSRALGLSEHKPNGPASSASAAMNKPYEAPSGGNNQSPIDLSRPGPKSREQSYRPAATIALRTAAQTYTTADRQKLANGGGNGKVERTTNVENGNRGQGAPPNTQTDVRPTSTSTYTSTDTLSRAIEHDQDLRDWLVMTDYHDVEARNRKLERHRKAKALAAEKERIEAEQRKLIEEEELELGFRRAPVATPSAAPTPTTVSAVTPLPSKPATEPKEFFRNSFTKRNFEENSDKGLGRPEKQLRMDDRFSRPEEIGLGIGEGSYRERDGRPTSRPDMSDARPRPQSRGTSPRRGPSPRRGFSPRRGPSPRRNPYPSSPPRRDYRRSPPPRPRDFSPHRAAHPTGPRFRPEHEGGRDEDRFQRQDAYRNDIARRRDPAQFLPTARFDLGGKGDTRFFIVKSFNEDNVLKCMEDGVWATQTKNGQLLTTAFANCQNVILFFSINKSRAFQGFARMATTPSPDTPRPKWMNGIHWDTSPPFRVEWLSKVPVEFFRIGHLKNSYNENMPVLVGKDGQEIEEKCGRELLVEMQAYADERADGDGGMRNPHASHGPAPVPRGPHGGGKKGKWQGNGHGRGQGSGQFHAHPHPYAQPQAPSPGPSNVKMEEDW